MDPHPTPGAASGGRARAPGSDLVFIERLQEVVGHSEETEPRGLGVGLLKSKVVGGGASGDETAKASGDHDLVRQRSFGGSV